MKGNTIAVAGVVLALIAAACGGGSSSSDTAGSTSSTIGTSSSPTSATSTEPPATTTTASTPIAASTPTVVLSGVVPAREVQQLQADALAFADSYYGSWPDIGPALDRMTEDVVFYDPADGDFIIEGKADVVPAILGFANGFSETVWIMDADFISADGVAYRAVIATGLWPPWLIEPPDHSPVVELDRFRFEEGAITEFDVWFGVETLEMLGFGCFAIEGCRGVSTIVDRYVGAWSSGAEDQIAALYAEDAVFTDSLQGIQAIGPASIGGLSEARFGSGRPTIEVLDLYAQTRGPAPATNEQPGIGPVIAVAIHYRISGPDGTTTQESLTTVELGKRHPQGFDLHPQGLITREEVFHNSDSILTASLTP